MKKKGQGGISWYSVYNHKGDHQASYDKCFEDAYSWAVDCAKHIGGYVCEAGKDQEEKVIFESIPNKKK